MNKKLVLALLSVCTLSNAMALVPEGDYSSGNWSIMLDLNTENLSKLINKEAGLSQYQGVNLVSWTGSSEYAYGGYLSAEGTHYGSTENRTASFWLGWGRSYFPGFDSGLDGGLQMGFASGNDAQLSNKPNLNTGFSGFENAGYYRSHTKKDTDNDFWQDSDESASTMNELVGLNITSASLAIVHSNKNGVDTNKYNPHLAYEKHFGLSPIQSSKFNFEHSQTMQYLTINYLKEDGTIGTITFIAEVDDGGTTDPSGALGQGVAPSSNRYDVDVLKNVNLNFEYIDGYEIINDALTHTQVQGFKDYIMVPEPASATLSMLALTALCARRRRRK